MRVPFLAADKEGLAWVLGPWPWGPDSKLVLGIIRTVVPCTGECDLGVPER